MVDNIPKISSAAFLRTFATGLLMLAAAAPDARAELIVFTHGRVLKVVSHQDAGERIEIRLRGGGSLTFDRSLVERIVDDELVGADVQAAPQPPGRAEAPKPARRKASTEAGNKEVATSKDPQESSQELRASNEDRLPPRRVRRHSR